MNNINKSELEGSVQTAIAPAEGNPHTIVSALSNVLPFHWNWVISGNELRITSDTADIVIVGKVAVWTWKV